MNAAAIRAILADLSRSRPIFHSEADFQHAFAVQVQRHFPGAHVRLERQVMPEARPKLYIDVECLYRGRRTAFELKYLTRAVSITEEGEGFQLMNQGAPDTRRHDVIKDVERLESVVQRGIADCGFVIALTNDATYWQPVLPSAANDAAFRLHEGRELRGTFRWSDWQGEAARPLWNLHACVVRFQRGRSRCSWHVPLPADTGLPIESAVHPHTGVIERFPHLRFGERSGLEGGA